MHSITIEVFGVGLSPAARRLVEIEVEAGATLEDVLEMLGRLEPALAERVLGVDGRSLRPPYVMNINGLDFVEDFKRKSEAGDRILLMAPPAGG